MLQETVKSLKEKHSVNQTVALFFEVTECCQSAKEEVYLIQHRPKSELAANTGCMRHRNPPLGTLSSAPMLAASLLFGLCSNKLPHSFTSNNRAKD